jgi:hypothetical protein
MSARRAEREVSPLFEIPSVLVRLDHVARCIVNANHSVMGAAPKFGVANRIADRVWFAIPQATDWQRIGNQIDAALISTRADFVNVHCLVTVISPEWTTQGQVCSLTEWQIRELPR